ncbi:hypothetical protein IEO21_09595 [Rhodonia placenta]|uniref:CCHC-type domain-containing protein n=1 Tax=Rhodonia placenta TaxID=104341 RepID=A0A8H7NU30_9APHY|nr:hypothetical protein IEO21_09595 [Postia placenta]
MSNISSTTTSNNAVNPVPLGLPALAGSPLLQYDRADHCFVTTARRTPIYPRGGTWVCAEGSNLQIVAHQQLVSYYQRHPPAHPEDVFATLRISVETAQTIENLQSPVNKQPLELPEVHDEAKIAFTVALMRKDLGKTWADAYYEKSAGGVQVYSTWADFIAALEEKNRKTALSLGNYVTRFEQLASKAQLKDTEVNGTNRVENKYHTLHANFVKGLPKELYFALATRVARDRPNTMKAWYDEVRNADAAKQGALVVTDTRDYDEPMDIDAAAIASTFASTLGGRKWELGAVLNEADQKLHRDGNLCFYCHIKGHSAKDCRKKAAARQGGGRPNQGGSGKDDFRARIKTLSADEKWELYEELTMEDF